MPWAGCRKLASGSLLSLWAPLVAGRSLKQVWGSTDDICYNFCGKKNKNKKNPTYSSVFSDWFWLMLKGRDLNPISPHWVAVRWVYTPHQPEKRFLFSLRTNLVPSKRQNPSLRFWRLSCWAIKNCVLSCLHIHKWTIFSMSAQIKTRLLILPLSL